MTFEVSVAYKRKHYRPCGGRRTFRQVEEFDEGREAGVLRIEETNGTVTRISLDSVVEWDYIEEK